MRGELEGRLENWGWDPVETRAPRDSLSARHRYDGDLSLPLGLALGSPIFPSGCEGKLGVALEPRCGFLSFFSA